MFNKSLYNAFDTYPSPANAGIEIEADGTITRFTSTTNNILIGRWDAGGPLVRADYDFRADRISGAGDFDGANKKGIWYPGSSLVAFSLLFVGFGVKNIDATLRMRPTGGGADIDTATLDIELDLT
jgi:hypothetical protein